MFKPITIYSRVTGGMSISKTTKESIELNRSKIVIQGDKIEISLDREVVILSKKEKNTAKLPLYCAENEEMKVLKGGTEVEIEKNKYNHLIMMEQSFFESIVEEYNNDIEKIYEEIQLKGIPRALQGVDQRGRSTIILAEVTEESVRDDEYNV